MIRKALKKRTVLNGPTPEEMTLMTAETTSSSTITTPPSPASDGTPRRRRPAPATLTHEFESWKAAWDARR